MMTPAGPSEAVLDRALREFLTARSRPSDLSLDDLAEWWERNVDVFCGCYQFGWDEYVNDCAIRRLLDELLLHPVLRQAPRMPDIRARVLNSDARLARAFIAGVEIGDHRDPWWRRGMLAHAGQEYARDALQLFDVRVDPCG